MEAKTSDKAIIVAMRQKEIKINIEKKERKSKVLFQLIETTIGLSKKLLLMGSGQVLDTTFY